MLCRSNSSQAPQIGSAVGLAADLAQPYAVDVVPERRIYIGHPDLDIAWSQYTPGRNTPLSAMATLPFGSLGQA
jgi:hypothetical protein